MFGIDLGAVIVPMEYVYGAMTIIVMGVVVFFLSAIKTPMLTWWKAYLLRRPLLAIARRDKYIDFQTPKVESGGATIKKYGFFEFNPDGIWNWPHGLWGGFVLSDKISMLTPELIEAADTLLASGFENYSEAETAEELSLIKAKNPGQEITYDWLAASGKYPTNFLGYAKTVLDKGLLEKMDDKLINRNLVAFHHIKNFFKYNATPSGTQKVINNEKANIIAKLQRPGFHVSMDHILGFVILMIGVALAYMFIQQGGGGQAASAASSVGDTAKQVGSNIGL